MKKAILSAAFIIGAFAANASYLVWQVNSDDYSAYATQKGYAWDRVRLVQVTGDNELSEEAWTSSVTSWNGSNRQGALGESSYSISTHTVTETGTSLNKELIGAPMTGTLAANLNDLSGSTYAYYVELVNSTSSEVFARSEAVTYTSLVNTGSLVSGNLALGNLASITPWHASGYTAVPEPTSAILMLFGAAFLGLKRKNRSIV